MTEEDLLKSNQEGIEESESDDTKKVRWSVGN